MLANFQRLKVHRTWRCGIWQTNGQMAGHTNELLYAYKYTHWGIITCYMVIHSWWYVCVCMYIPQLCYIMYVFNGYYTACSNSLPNIIFYYATFVFLFLGLTTSMLYLALWLREWMWWRRWRLLEVVLEHHPKRLSLLTVGSCELLNLEKLFLTRIL